MIKKEIETSKGIIVELIAENGKLLTDNETISDSVYLGINDSIENWHEIDDTEAEDITSE